jgi:hypothetical protein
MGGWGRRSGLARLRALRAAAADHSRPRPRAGPSPPAAPAPREAHHLALAGRRARRGPAAQLVQQRGDALQALVVQLDQRGGHLVGGGRAQGFGGSACAGGAAAPRPLPPQAAALAPRGVPAAPGSHPAAGCRPGALGAVIPPLLAVPPLLPPPANLPRAAVLALCVEVRRHRVVQLQLQVVDMVLWVAVGVGGIKGGWLHTARGGRDHCCRARPSCPCHPPPTPPPPTPTLAAVEPVDGVLDDAVGAVHAARPAPLVLDGEGQRRPLREHGGDALLKGGAPGGGGGGGVAGAGAVWGRGGGGWARRAAARGAARRGVAGGGGRRRSGGGAAAAARRAPVQRQRAVQADYAAVPELHDGRGARRWGAGAGRGGRLERRVGVEGRERARLKGGSDAHAPRVGAAAVKGAGGGAAGRRSGGSSCRVAQAGEGGGRRGGGGGWGGVHGRSTDRGRAPTPHWRREGRRHWGSR